MQVKTGETEFRKCTMFHFVHCDSRFILNIIETNRCIEINKQFCLYGHKLCFVLKAHHFYTEDISAAS